MDVVSGKRLPIPCRPCEITGTHKPAVGYCQNCQEYLCDNCYKNHTMPAPCRHHILLDKDQMPTRLPKTTVSSNDATDYCLQHITQTLQYYCDDHSVCICNRCLNTSHKGCKYGKIADLADSSKLNTEFQDTLKAADCLRQLCKINIKASHDAIVEVNQVKVDIEEAIKKLRGEINGRFDAMEASLKKECDQVINTENKRLADLNKMLDDMVNEINKMEKSLKGLHTEGRYNKLFIGIKAASYRLNELMKREAEINEKNVIQALEFVPNIDLMDKLEVIQARDQLGKLVSEQRTTPGDVLTQRLAVTEAKDGHILKHKTVVLNHTGELNVTMSCEKDPSDITGIVSLYPDEVIIADRTNRSIKRVNIRRNKVMAVQGLTNKPWDITILPDNELAVTIPAENLVEIISFSDNALSFSRQFKTQHSCFGVCYSENKLFATSFSYTWRSKARIVAFNLSGEVIDEFDCNGMFREPYYVIANITGKYLYVTDKTRKSVTKLSIKGSILGDYMLEEPVDSGLQELKDGTILICCRARGDIVRLSIYVGTNLFNSVIW